MVLYYPGELGAVLRGAALVYIHCWSGCLVRFYLDMMAQGKEVLGEEQESIGNWQDAVQD